MLNFEVKELFNGELFGRLYPLSAVVLTSIPGYLLQSGSRMSSTGTSELSDLLCSTENLFPAKFADIAESSNRNHGTVGAIFCEILNAGWESRATEKKDLCKSVRSVGDHLLSAAQQEKKDYSGNGSI